jgi:hypothetical protein
LWNTDLNNFAPHLGVAYNVRPQTVLRASYGIFYQPLGADNTGVIQSGYSSLTSFVPSLDNGQHFIATLSNPFPNGFSQPVGSAGGLETFLGQAVKFVSPQIHEPYTQRWTAGAEQMLPGKILLDVSYMGSHSVHLFVSENLNTTPRQFLSTSATRDQATINLLNQQVASPFYGIAQFQDTSLSGQTIAMSQLLKPYPQFGNITMSDNAGSSSYHSLDLVVQKRYSSGITLQAIYTYSKFLQSTTRLNPTDPKPEHVISPADRTNYLTINSTYELPFGRGKHWLNTSGLSDKIFGGWSLVGLYIAETGAPIQWGNIIFSGNVNTIPLPASERKPTKWFNTGAGFNMDSQGQLADNIRTFPSMLSGVRAKGANDISLSLFKDLTLKERWKIKLYAQMVNATNDMSYDLPVTDPTSSLFGSVTDITQGALGRNTTLGAKMTW